MRKSRLMVEELEDRTVPALFGNPWPDAQHLTLSFVPDGTPTANGVSSLFRTLDALAPTSTWQGEVLRAFQTWAINANINISLVTDGGQPLGTTGAPEGDARFGDIRIAAEALSPGVLALASPFDFLAGTRSGDVRLNSLAFSPGATPHDLFSVLLHEAGHVFGLDESDNPASPLYEAYTGVRSGLTPEDIARLQALYGPRSADAFDAKRPNDTLASASSVASSGSSLVQTADADLTTLGDVDWYQFKTSGKPGGVTVQLRTAGLSLLSARVSVYDVSGRLLATADAQGEPGTDLRLRFDQLSSTSIYFVKVERATNDVFGIGSYRLEVSQGSSPTPVAQQPTTTRIAPDAGATVDAALSLQQHVYRTDARFDYAYSGTFSSGEVRYFRLKAPTADAGTPTVLTIMTWATQPSGGQPLLTVYDAAGNLVNTDVLVRENGTFVVQVRNAVPNAQYVVAVQAGIGQGASGYFLGADFGTQATQLDTFVDNPGLAPGTAAVGTLHVNESRLFHFVLSAGSVGDSPGGVVRLDILDAAGNLVACLTATAGQSLSTTLLLGPGDYTFRFTTDSPSGAPSFTLKGLVVDDPIGPELADPTLAPLAPTGTTSGTTSTSYVYFWQISYYTFLTSGSTSLSPTTN